MTPDYYGYSNNTVPENKITNFYDERVIQEAFSLSQPFVVGNYSEQDQIK